MKRGGIVFLQQFLRRFHTTGAVAPSGRRLARALARCVASGNHPLRILEVGPGTGSVTRAILESMAAEDSLDLVEINPVFVAHLQALLGDAPLFRQKADVVRLFQIDVTEYRPDRAYDVIVSGLPLNNFSAEMVESILASFVRMAAEGASVSFFQYIGLRRLKSWISRASERRRLEAVGRAIDRARSQREIRRERVCWNFPPAWVHHLRIESNPQALRSVDTGNVTSRGA